MIIEKIQNVTKEQIQKMIFVGLEILMLLLPLPQCFLPDDYRSVVMQATVLMISLIYFGIIVLIEVRNKSASFKKQGVAFLCIYGLVLVGILSVLLSEDKKIALYGQNVRSEGFFSLLSYYMIFIIVTLLIDKNYRRQLLYLFLILGCVIAVMGCLQFIIPWEWGERFYGMAYVPMRNPNFYGAFAVLFVGIAIGGFLTYKEYSDITHPFQWWNRWVWFALVLLGYAACISADSSVVYAGLIMVFLMELFLQLITKKRKFLPLVLLVIGLGAMMLLFDLLRGGTVSEEFFSVGKQIQTEGSLFGDSVGSSRMMGWKQIVGLLPQYWLFGCGIENLGGTYIDKYGRVNGTFFDKAHNEYLNLWVTEGIFAILFYLIFLFALFLPGIIQFVKKWRNNSKLIKEKYVFDDMTRIVFYAFFGYIAQAFFNISVVQVAPYFWLICGLLYSRKRV